MAARLKNYEKRALMNRHFLSNMKTERRKYLKLIEGKKMEEAKSAFSNLDRTIQKLKSKGIIHRNKASRLLSRLAKKKEIK